MKHLGVVAALALAVTGCGSSGGGRVAQNGSIVVSSQGGIGQRPGLFVRRPGGSLQRITGGSGVVDVSPVWDHRGKQIAYVRRTKPFSRGAGTLMVVDADGSHAHRVGEVVVAAGTIDWSPDDGSLIYSGATRKTDGIWTIDLDGARPRRITDDGVEPSWSTGGRIVFARLGHALATMAADGSDVRELPRAKRPPKAILPDSYSAPVWSPDGTRIAYVHKVWLPSKELLYPTTIETANPDGSDRHVVTKVLDPTDTTLDWSPDGKLIVFTDVRGDRVGLWSIPSSGGRVKLLIDSSRYWTPSWGPAGT